MTKTRAAIVLLTVVTTSLACDDDPNRPSNGASGPTFQPLTSRDAVVNNLEMAWNLERIDKIDELLDPDFVFYFDPSDVWGDIPPTWPRSDEITATSGLFDSDHAENPSGPVCNDVQIDLVFDELTWAEVPVPVPATATTEVRYRTTIGYAFMFKMEPDLTYIQNNAYAQLTVRQEGSEWRLIEWRDLREIGSRAFAADQEASWGTIKALYR